MGGTTFLVTAAAATIGDAYRDAVADAHYSCGHGGYSGTIAEKAGYVDFGTLPADLDAVELADLLVNAVSYDRWDGDSQQYVPSPPTDEPVRLTALFGAGTAARMIDVYDDKWGTRGRHPAPHRRTVLRLHGMGIDMTQRCLWCHGAVEGLKRGPAWFERAIAAHALSCPVRARTSRPPRT
jgi:hypothetical protein